MPWQSHFALPGGFSFARPFGIATDAQGNVYVGGNGSATVMKLNQSGEVVDRFKGGGLHRPMDLATDSSGNVWVSNSTWVVAPCENEFHPEGGPSEGGTVTLIKRNGNVSKHSPYRGGGLKNAWGVAVDGADNVWVANFSGRRLSELCGTKTQQLPGGQTRRRPPDLAREERLRLRRPDPRHRHRGRSLGQRLGGQQLEERPDPDQPRRLPDRRLPGHGGAGQDAADRSAGTAVRGGAVSTRDERTAALVRRFYDELWNEWRLDLADELLAESVRFRGSLGFECEDREAFKGYVEAVRGRLPRLAQPRRRPPGRRRPGRGPADLERHPPRPLRPAGADRRAGRVPGRRLLPTSPEVRIDEAWAVGDTWGMWRALGREL